jgi:hypothetical protein
MKMSASRSTAAKKRRSEEMGADLIALETAESGSPAAAKKRRSAELGADLIVLEMAQQTENSVKL